MTMPKECIGCVKYKDGHSTIGYYRLPGGYAFGFSEMKHWIMERDPDIVEVTVSKVRPEQRQALRKMADAEHGKDTA